MMNTPDHMARRALTVEEAARVLGIGRSSAYAAAKEGSLPVVRVGRRLLVPVGRLEALLGETTNENSPTAANREAENSDTGAVRHEVSIP